MSEVNEDNQQESFRLDVLYRPSFAWGRGIIVNDADRAGERLGEKKTNKFLSTVFGIKRKK